MYFITMVLQQGSQNNAEDRIQTKAKPTKLPENSARFFKGLNVHF